jgi:DNA-binding PadR family transcriptional regulator
MSMFLELKHGSKISVESIYRVLRKLRERGIFFTPPKMKGQRF